MTDYADLSANELAKQINDEYGVILASEKANLPRALAIAEKLIALRARTVHGQWQAKLSEWCPQISYATAALYIRLYEKQDAWRAAATAKSLGPTDLTIEAARQLLAKPKAKSESDDEADDDGKPTAEAMIAKQTANAEEEAAELDDADDVEGWFGVAVKAFNRDELLALTEMLAKHLGMTLMPADTTDKLAALEEIISDRNNAAA